MLRIYLSFFVSFFFFLVSFSQNKHEYVGGVKLSDTILISYKIKFTESDGEVKGYSITDIGGEHETKSNIFGEYDVDNKVLSFRETGIVYTKSTVSQNDFCFLNTTIKNFIFGKTKKVKANFIGLFSDNTECINGEILLNAFEQAEERAQKLVNKISKSKKVPDSLKQKLREINLMDTFKINMLKKNQTLSIFTNSNSIKFIIYDGGKEDGDKITILVNNDIVLNTYEADKLKKYLDINLDKRKTSIVIKAVNEGSISPNTVVVEIDDGINKIKALSNLKKNETTQIDVLKH
ncbi:MAG: hypothetical protein P8K68_07470 [Algibacter sp.]|uniref:hypothetical protein n=1 Tax=Algibacter sp. TaxID=1872428 RepID=UPI002629AFC9|nr:hypothetical protein [Algibacter sp.]MDG1729400.1 hypothetical protein [Algibacter sp.]MDG2178612.1 hypothetical protein [Algibacter sp.]